jgi:hypothetical protein
MQPAPAVGWALLGGAGLVFALVASSDVVLALYPPHFGVGEWEFGTVTSVLQSFPLFTMGWGLVFGAAVARGNLRTVRFLAVLFALFALLVVAGLVVYFRTVPDALQIVEDRNRAGLIRAIWRTGLQGGLYGLAFCWMSVQGWKSQVSS